ncbi:MAG TPA: biopolymer transporter ExbD [Melioribacteraceae bacterium]|nr:biopolymer transporter ExbD [Melioribacteraceae bacterium]
MKFEKRRANSNAAIPTASLSDIIFILLLFFMVTTTLREVDVLVQYKLPEAKAIEKIENKRLVTYLWIGRDERIQLNDAIVKLEEIQDIMYNKRVQLPQVIVSLRIDKNSSMGIVTDVQQKLRRADARRINYSTLLAP